MPGILVGDEFPVSIMKSQHAANPFAGLDAVPLKNVTGSEYKHVSTEGCVPADIASYSTGLPPVDFNGSVCGWLRSLTFFAGIDGSKQPQDYGVNANLGLQGNVNAGVALDDTSGLGLQLGTGIVGTQNAVRVYELLGEATSRTQSYTTIGLFQRTDSGLIWAVAHDFMVEQSYDRFILSQWRGRVGYDVDGNNQFGITAQLRGLTDSGSFNGGPVSLRTINQSSLYWRHVWESSTQTAMWVGLADSHGENNAVTGPSASQSTVPLFGADFLSPLNDHIALYGEANLIMPSDTGTVDAFLGFQWFPGGGAKRARRTRFEPVFSVAAPTSFSVDLR
ncbi:MAG: DUF6666 family protein [Planctomycetaceae bacterium]